nr:MAG TPA: hypothetical protein [Caudoviricetes sp.]
MFLYSVSSDILILSLFNLCSHPFLTNKKRQSLNCLGSKYDR